MHCHHLQPLDPAAPVLTSCPDTDCFPTQFMPLWFTAPCGLSSPLKPRAHVCMHHMHVLVLFLSIRQSILCLVYRLAMQRGKDLARRAWSGQLQYPHGGTNHFSTPASLFPLIPQVDIVHASSCLPVQYSLPCSASCCESRTHEYVTHAHVECLLGIA